MTQPPMSPEELYQLDRALIAVRNEVIRARRHKPPFTTRHEGYAVFLEEADEFWDEVKANNHELQIYECTQAGAMAVRYLMDIKPTTP